MWFLLFIGAIFASDYAGFMRINAGTIYNNFLTGTRASGSGIQDTPAIWSHGELVVMATSAACPNCRVVYIGGRNCDALYHMCRPFPTAYLITRSNMSDYGVPWNTLASPKIKQLTVIPSGTISLYGANYVKASQQYDSRNLYGTRCNLIAYKANAEEIVFGAGLAFDSIPPRVSPTPMGDFWALNVSSSLYRPLTLGDWWREFNVYSAIKQYHPDNAPGARYSSACAKLPWNNGAGIFVGGLGYGNVNTDFWMINFTTTQPTVGFTLISEYTYGWGNKGEMSEHFFMGSAARHTMFNSEASGEIFILQQAMLWKINASNANPAKWLQGWIAGFPLNTGYETPIGHSQTDNQYSAANTPHSRQSAAISWLTDEVFVICGGYAEITQIRGLELYSMDIWLYNTTSNMFMYKGNGQIASAGTPGTKDVYSDSTWPRGRAHHMLMAISPTKMILYGGATTTPLSALTARDYFSSEAYVIGIYSCHGYNVLDPLSCAGNGECVGQDKCTCRASTEPLLKDCSAKCFGVMINSTSQCSGHGTCIQADKCACATGYAGPQCSEWSCNGIQRTSLSVCSGAGTCVASNVCSCKQKFGGSNCEDYGCFGVAITNTSFVCSQHGTCIVPDSCRCDANYFGENCQIFGCNGISRLSSDACNGYGACVAEDKCECRSGHFGPWCETFGCSGVSSYNSSGTCSGHGLCVGENTCRCDSNHFGEDCEIFGCANISSLHKNVCSGRGKCVTENVCVCSDSSLWQGPLCDESTQLSETITTVTIATTIAVIVFISLGIICTVLIVLLCVSRKLRRFQKIKDIDLLMAESEMVVTTPKLSVDKECFQIKAEDIHVVKKIGSGGSGTQVWLAKWSNQTVAYKTFTFDLCSFGAFEAELKLMMSLRHPNILSCFGAVLQETLAGYLMEFASNGDLLDYVTRSNASLAERKRLLAEAASALVFVHSHNIIHRDIKAENILVSEDRRAKLMDFGVSRAIKTTDATKTAKVGTSNYMAPEITTGNSYSLQADVFSFAILIWVVVVGRDDPYNAHTANNSLTGTLGIERAVAHNENIRPDCDEFCRACPQDVVPIEFLQRMWDADPEKRLTMANVLAELSRK
jgi:hypothetical protein